MPKLKTVKGVSSRMRRTARGKLLRAQAGRRHLLHGKRAKRKRQLRRTKTLAPSEARKLLQLMPYA